jgi:two-component system invasion response regulator UvrY
MAFSDPTKHLLIVDAHEITRQGYISVLSAWRRGLVFGEAGSFPEALHQVTERSWDLIILEVCMPGRSGLELLDQLASVGSDVPVLVSTLHDEESYGIRAIRRGVSGYLCKSAGVQEFIHAVEMLLEGKKYLSGSLLQSLMGAMHPSTPKRPHEELSDREFQVLQRLAAGAAIKHMAQEMCLSPKTVSTYRTRIMKKLGVSSLVGLVEYCLEHRLTGKQAAEEQKGFKFAGNPR